MKKIPKFKTQEEAAKYWETHSFEDYHKDTKNGKIVFAKKAKKQLPSGLIRTISSLSRKSLNAKA